MAVSSKGNTVTMIGTVNKSTAWFGDGTWNNNWAVLGIKLPENFVPLYDATSSLLTNANVFTYRQRTGWTEAKWENSGTYEPIIKNVNGADYLLFSIPLDSSSLKPGDKVVELKVSFGNHIYTGGEAEVYTKELEIVISVTVFFCSLQNFTEIHPLEKLRYIVILDEDFYNGFWLNKTYR